MFPVYGWGMPRLVTEFIEQAEFGENGYIFGVATAGGVVGSTLKDLHRLLKKKKTKLDAGFGVKAPSYDYVPDAEPIGPIKFIQSLAGKKLGALQTFEQRREEILQVVASKSTVLPESTTFAANTFGSLLHTVALDAFKHEDDNYLQEESCNQCGQCIKLCSRGNIALKNMRLEWFGNCEGCRACIMLCPQEAIGYRRVPEVSRSYNPSVTIKDLIF